MSQHRKNAREQQAADRAISRRTVLDVSLLAAIAGTLVGGLGEGSLEAAVAQPRSRAGASGISLETGVRRIVTANNAQGKSFVLSDERVTGGQFPSLFKATGDSPLGPGASDELKKILPTDAPQLEPSAGGSSFHFVTLPPWKADTKPLWHRTTTLDYNILLEGELVMMVETGEVTLHPGDVVVQRNTLHAWKNGSTTAPVRWVAVLVPIGRSA
jgi:mannose-6-phosphate isomerase-like protein (cupin superfamily)